MRNLMCFLILFISFKCQALLCNNLAPGNQTLALPPVIQWQKEVSLPWYTLVSVPYANCISASSTNPASLVYVINANKVGVYNYNGAAHDLYSTSIDKVFFVAQLWSYDKQVWVPATSSDFVSMPVSYLGLQAMKISIRIAFVDGGGSLTPGNFPIAPLDLASVWVRELGSSDRYLGKAVSSATSLQVKSKSCRLKVPDLVKLPIVDFSQFQSIGSIAGETPFQLSVDCSDSFANYAVSFFMTDVNKPDNKTSVLISEIGANFSTGVGVEIMDASTPIAFGSEQNSVNKRLIGTVLKEGGSLVKSLSAHYKRTSALVTPGPLSAGVTITLVYD